ncbi:RND family transporter [Bacteriovorax sp. DB6_IX]|uniref:efflux RND transporter permease subunit n=1 Tax=Bacteriovorax sp. DB6_IX TaxID=1353530 RepID=UPI00038A2846|nr:MMPL family transporter [Bacteriovorax sp. DB6_IX]EQC51867.1 MMPL family protein [Bacteriovorax sp. DB6_IX]
MKKVDKFSQELSKSIVQNPIRWIIFALTILLIAASGLYKIKTNFSVKVWLQPEDQRIHDLEYHEATFGSSDTIDVIVYNKKGIFNKETIETIQKITDQMWQVTDVVRVESLTNANWIDTLEDDINISPFFDEETSLDIENLKKKRDMAVNDEQMKNNSISHTGNVAYIRSFLRVYKKNPAYKQIVNEVEELTKKFETEDIKVHHSGIAYINESLSRASDRDMKLVFPVVVLCLVLILALFFRSFLSIVYPFALIGVSIIATFGIEGHLGLEFNNILSAVPAVLIAIGLADAVHILISYRHNIVFEHEDNITAAIHALKKNFIPTVLTTVTTSIGFFSLTTAEIRPIHDLGLLSGLGTVLAWIFTYFLLGPLLKFINFKKREINEDLSELSFLYNFCFKHKNWINISLPLLGIVMAFYGSKNIINADPVEYFDDSTPVKKTFNLVRSEFGGSRAIEMVFDSEKPEGVKDPEFLNKADKLINWINENPKVVRVNSLIQIIKKMNQTLHEGKAEYYAIPETRRAVADQLFLYTLGLPEGMDLKNQLSLDNRKFRVIVMWDVNDTMNSIAGTQKILDKAKEIGINVYEAGQSPIYNRINDLVVQTFISSMSISIPVIFFIMLIVFRDFKLAVLSLIPNIFPLATASGIMYFNGDEINIGNVIVFSVCLGIAVDDTIHFIANYKIKKSHGMCGVTALKSTLAQTGKALILTTIMLMFGFGMFVLGEFVPNQKFGVYCAVILFLALVSDLILLPAILLATEKKEESEELKLATSQNS